MEGREEVWRDVPGWEGAYQASNLGRLRSVDRIDCRGRNLRGVVLKQTANKRGYKHVSMSLGGNIKCVRVAAAVCSAFHGERPRGKEVAHLNGKAGDNASSNLAWVTHKENESHKRLHGTLAVGKRNGHYTKPWRTPVGERTNKSRLTAFDVRTIRRTHKKGFGSAYRMGKWYGVSKQAILHIIHRRNWKHI